METSNYQSNSSASTTDDAPSNKLTGEEIAGGMTGGILMGVSIIAMTFLKLLLLPFCIAFSTFMLMLGFIVKHYLFFGTILLIWIILVVLNS